MNRTNHRLEDFQGPDVNEEEQQRDGRSGQQHEDSAGDGGDGAAGADDRGRIEGGVTDAGHDAAGKIEPQVPQVSHAVVDVIAEDIQEQHVPQHVQPALVHELVGEILPELGVLRIQGQEVADGLSVIQSQRPVGVMIAGDGGQHEHGEVERDQRPIHPWDASQGAVSVQRDQHDVG